jgi:dienelactone hydrolase
MKHLAFFAFVFLLPLLLLGQMKGVINHQAVHFQVKNGAAPIDFIVIDTLLQEKKPVFLFCQGSLPMPLFAKTAAYGTFIIGGGITNFDVSEIRKRYHLVVISMPETPLIVNESNLSKSYTYVPDTANQNQLSVDFLKADYLENYVQRAEKVLHFLKKQTWVKSSKLVVAGHSQGSKIAAALALKNKKITHLGLFGANPFGRVDQFVRQFRKDAEQKKISWEEAEQKTQEYYQFYEQAQKNTNEDPSLIAWKSFSTPMIDTWLKIEIPVYLAYGSNDITSDLCDLVPLLFIYHHKNNLSYKRYPGLEHNFFETDDSGRPNYDKGHWKEVMSDFVKWTAK